MHVSRDDLTQTFREFSDEDLLARVRAGNLTELAQEIVANELRSRGLGVPTELSVANELGTVGPSTATDRSTGVSRSAASDGLETATAADGLGAAGAADGFGAAGAADGTDAADDSGAADDPSVANDSSAADDPGAADEPNIISAAERYEALAAVFDESDLELVTVHRLVNPLTANVLRACLESHGIYVHLWGEHLGTAHIVFSAATGGMRIQVPRGQAAQATEIITAWENGEISMDDAPATDDAPE